MKCSVDTSALVNGWQKYYPPDAFPSLWEKLGELFDQEWLVATEEVKHELEKKDDELLKWAKARPKMFVSIDCMIQVAVKEILANHPRLLDTKKNRSGADPFVIALAKVCNGRVLTDERSSNSTKNPRIPDVCSSMGIPCIRLLDLIREKQWVFRA